MGLYARCRGAIQRTHHYRRLARRFPIVAILTAGLFLWTTSKLHHGSAIIPVLFGVGVNNQRETYTDIIYGQPQPPGTDRPEWEPGACNVPEIEFLRRPQLGLTSNIVYSRRCIKPIRNKSTNRDRITDLPGPLIPTKTAVNLTSCAYFELPPCETIAVPVPSPYPRKQYPHLLFGVASTYDRLVASLPEFAHFLSSTSAPLLAIVADATPSTNLTALDALYRSNNILATFLPPNTTSPSPLPVEHHHFLLVRALLAHSTPSTQWLSIIDDDTFFPSLYPLSLSLSKHDPTLPIWLGALSDDFSAVQRWGYMAFGGAGTFLSKPIAKVVASHTDDCLSDVVGTNQGDGLLRDCIYKYSRTKLTVMEGLHQLDIRGDPSGFFESGIRPLSLHHWKSWYKAPVAAISRIATLVCGDCLLQRFKFGKDTILSNGYSIAVYNDTTLEGIDLERVEGTWMKAGKEYEAAYGELREKIGVEGKRSYLLRGAWMEVGGRGKRVFRQVYVYRVGESEYEQREPMGVDEVVELEWEV